MENVNKRFKAFAPATVANLGCGFDVLGLALSSLGDHVSVYWNRKINNEIVSIKNAEGISTVFSENCCGVVIEAMQKALGVHQNVDVEIEKGYRSGSGLGSSAASCAAAAMAYNAINGNPFSKKELVEFAALGEQRSSGVVHVDNVAPAIYGGITLMVESSPLKVINLNYPQDLYVVVVFPDIVINTQESRALLRDQVSLSEASRQSAYLGGFLTGLQIDNVELMQQSMVDLLVEPSRKSSIPFFDDLKQKAMSQGAIGFSISGSGPSVFALVKGKADAEKVQQELVSFCQLKDINHISFIDQINAQGAYMVN